MKLFTWAVAVVLMFSALDVAQASGLLAAALTGLAVVLMAWVIKEGL